MDSFINSGSAFEFPSTPAAMSSFFATQTRFTTPITQAVTNTPAAVTPTDPALPNTSTTSPFDPRLSSGAGRKTISKSGIGSSTQTAAVGATTSNSSNGAATSIAGTSIASPGAASSGSNGGVLASSQSCDSISCSSSLKAAIAVPVTLVGLALLAALFILLRRRRRRRRQNSSGASISSVSNGEPRGSRWARHLRVFSFDAELLIGAHSSTSDSIRSAPTVREQPSQTSLRSQQMSVRTLESPAPPYRDALSAPAPTGMQMVERPDSQLTAPPPYIVDRGAHRSASRLSSVTRPGTQASDPFADPEPEEEDDPEEIESAEIEPVEDEPVSPVSRRTHVRKSSSAYHPMAMEAFTLTSDPRRESSSEAGSMLHAVLGRSNSQGSGEV